MEWFRLFSSNTVTLDKEAYAAILREPLELREDKRRLLAELDSLKTELKQALEDCHKIREMKAVAAKPLTMEDVAHRLRMPLSLAEYVDWDKLGVQFSKRDPRVSH